MFQFPTTRFFWVQKHPNFTRHRCAKLHDEGLCKKDDPTTAERCVALLVAQHRFYRREAKEDGVLEMTTTTTTTTVRPLGNFEENSKKKRSMAPFEEIEEGTK